MSRSKQLTDKQSDAVRKALRLLIKRLGSQARVVEVTGLSGATLSNLLGEKTGAGMMSAERIAAALNVPVAEMLRLDEKALALATSPAPPAVAAASAIDPDADDDEDVDLSTIPVLRVRSPRGDRADVEYVDRYPTRPPVIKSYEGVYDREVLEAVLLDQRHGADPGESFWRAEIKRVWRERELAKLEKAAGVQSPDFSMLGSPEKPDE